jgi:hypothetical protein
MAGEIGSAGPAASNLAVFVPLAGALLGPIVGAVAGIIARFGLQNKITQAEFRLKRLDLVEKALAVEKALGDKLQASSATEILLAEYQQVISTIASTRAQEAAAAAAPPRSTKGLRKLILPWPLSVGGWVATGLYYFYAIAALVYIPLCFVGPPDGLQDFLSGVFGSVIIATGAYYFAMRSWTKHSMVRRAT